MAREFHTEALHLKLALTAYLMTMAILVPASGWLADRYRRAPRLRERDEGVSARIAVLRAFQLRWAELVAARVLQGIGGAMMTPVARLIVVASTPRERLVQAHECLHHSGHHRAADGAAAGGTLLEIASWRWIFFINLPVGLLGIAAVLRIVPRLRHRPPRTLRWVRICHRGGRDRHVDPVVRIGGIRIAVPAAAACRSPLPPLAAWIVFIRSRPARARSPMLDLRLLAKSTYRASMLGGSLLRLGIGATPFLLAAAAASRARMVADAKPAWSLPS